MPRMTDNVEKVIRGWLVHIDGIQHTSHSSIQSRHTLLYQNHLHICPALNKTICPSACHCFHRLHLSSKEHPPLRSSPAPLSKIVESTSTTQRLTIYTQRSLLRCEYHWVAVSCSLREYHTFSTCSTPWSTSILSLIHYLWLEYLPHLGLEAQ